MTPLGKKLFTENKEDASITAVDIAVSPGRVLDPIALPGPIGGVAASPRHPYLVAAAADRPALYSVDSHSHQLRGTLTLDFHHQDVQVVRFNADGSLLAVIGDGEPVVTRLDGDLTPLAALNVGNNPMNGCFSPDNALLLIANEDDGTLSVIDLNLLRVFATLRVGEGCEVLGYFPLMGA